MKSTHACRSLVMGVLLLFSPAPVFAHLHPTLGTFIQRDPLRYRDGRNLYCYLRSTSPSLRDPNGKRCQATTPTPQPRTDQQCCHDYETAHPTTSTGITVCCDGRKVACRTSAPLQIPGNNNPLDPGALACFDDCTREHECSHFDDIDCGGGGPGAPGGPGGPPTRPGFTDPSQSNIDYQECVGLTILKRCLQQCNMCNTEHCSTDISTIIAAYEQLRQSRCHGQEPPPDLEGCNGNTW